MQSWQSDEKNSKAWQAGWFSLKVACQLTDCHCVVDLEAAENLVNVSGLEKAVSSHDHLKGLWFQDTHRQFLQTDRPKEVLADSI